MTLDTTHSLYGGMEGGMAEGVYGDGCGDVAQYCPGIIKRHMELTERKP